MPLQYGLVHQQQQDCWLAAAAVELAAAELAAAELAAAELAAAVLAAAPLAALADRLVLRSIGHRPLPLDWFV